MDPLKNVKFPALFTLCQITFCADTKIYRCSMNTYVFLHFRDRPGAALLRYSEKSRQNHHSYVLTETSSIWSGFRAGAKAILYSVNIALILAPLTTGATRTKIQTKNKNSAMVMLWLETTKKKQKPCLHA